MPMDNETEAAPPGARGDAAAKRSGSHSLQASGHQKAEEAALTEAEEASGKVLRRRPGKRD